MALNHLHLFGLYIDETSQQDEISNHNPIKNQRHIINIFDWVIAWQDRLIVL